MKLEQVFAQVLNESEENLNDETSPQTLAAWNSLRHIELIVAIETAYGAHFSGPEIASLRSLGAIRSLLRTRYGIQSA